MENCEKHGVEKTEVEVAVAWGTEWRKVCLLCQQENRKLKPQKKIKQQKRL